MYRHLLIYLLCANPLLLSAQSVSLRTVEEICKKYPDQTGALFQQLRLDSPGLEKVAASYANHDLVAAAGDLISYFRRAAGVNLLARDQPGISNRTTTYGDSVLQDIYTFQEVSDQVPRLENGKLNWYHDGPEADIEWAWALNRHYPVSSLLEAWYETGNRRYLEYADRFIQDWIVSSWPYPGVKSSTAMWRGLEVSFRVKVWARIFFELMNNDAISDATRLLILISLPEHAHYARHFHAENNWLTMEISGLATVAAYWPEFRESPDWLAYTIQTMVNSMKDQIYPDGVQTELTSSYHYVALNNFTQFQEICQRAGVTLPAYYQETLEKMWSYLTLTMRPDGSGILNNDADRMDNRQRIREYLEKKPNPEWEYVVTNGRSGSAPEANSWIFPWAGQLISRNDYSEDAHWSFFDFGPWGSGHQHNDKLHLSIAAFGHDFLVDAGRFAYRGEVAEKFRGYARGSAGHNVILFNGQGQAPGPKLADQAVSSAQFKLDSDYDYSWGEMSLFLDSASNHRHLRTVMYLRDAFWVVIDKVQSEKETVKEILWHWHPGCDVSFADGHRVMGKYPDGSSLTMIPVGRQPWEINLIKGQDKPDIQGWYSPVYNIYEPNFTSIYRSPQNRDDIYVWILFPSRGFSPGLNSSITEKNNDFLRLEVEVSGQGIYRIKIPFRNSEEVEYLFSRN